MSDYEVRKARDEQIARLIEEGHNNGSQPLLNMI